MLSGTICTIRGSAADYLICSADGTAEVLGIDRPVWIYGVQFQSIDTGLLTIYNSKVVGGSPDGLVLTSSDNTNHIQFPEPILFQGLTYKKSVAADRPWIIYMEA